MASENTVVSNDVAEICKIIKKYAVILDTFVKNFFIDDLWEAVPLEWRLYLESLPIHKLAALLDFHKPLPYAHCMPSSLRQVREDIIIYSINRKPICTTGDSELNVQKRYKRLIERVPMENRCRMGYMTQFFRKTKLKKCYEIITMAELLNMNIYGKSVDFVVDIGSGKGHLARILSLVYDLQVIALERDQYLNNKAKELDITVANDMKGLVSIKTMPVHINCEIGVNMTVEEFETILGEVLKLQPSMKKDFTYGVIGLHPCGDLAPTLMRLYKAAIRCKFINIVSCCYHKMTAADSCWVFRPDRLGYPLNKHVPAEKMQLSYNLRELACHGIENYVTKIETGYYDELKTHVYRAILQKLLLERYPTARDIRINNVKFHRTMEFAQYYRKATRGTMYVIEDSALRSQTVVDMISRWKQIVIFYCLRLMFAPLVETLILRDRQLYLNDNCTSPSVVRPLFMADISPRNLMLLSAKPT